MNKLTKFLAAAGLSAALVIAQRGGTPTPGGEVADAKTRIETRVSFLASLLSLTDDQKSRATTIFTEAYEAGQDERAGIQSARQSLADAVKKNNTVAIDQLAGEIGRLSGQLTAVDSKADAAFYALLTPEQQAKYDAMPHGGPGGRPGPEGFGRRRGPGAPSAPFMAH